MKRLIVIIFAISLVALGFAGGQSYLANSYRRQAEVGYRRALAELATHLQALSSELCKAQIAHSEEQRDLIGASVRRLIYAAQGNLGELPLGTVQLERVEHLLARTATATYAFREGSDELVEAYEQVEYISHELQGMLQAKQSEGALAARASGSFAWTALTALNAGLEELKMPPRSGEIVGEEISQAEAVAIAAEFSRIEDVQFIVANESKGAVPTYTVQGKDERQHIVVEISRRGGHVLWMTVLPEQTGTEQFTLGELAELGKTFLADRDFPQMQITDAQVLNNRALFTFVPKREGVLRYAEPVRVQVSTDSGVIVGFWAAAYHLAQSRSQQPLEVSESEAWDVTDKIRAGAEILDRKRALILDQQEREILVERLGVRYQEQYYLIYLNAQNGKEERIVPVTSPQFF